MRPVEELREYRSTVGLISMEQRFHIVLLGTHDLCLQGGGRARLPCLPASLTWFSYSLGVSESADACKKTPLTPLRLSH